MAGGNLENFSVDQAASACVLVLGAVGALVSIILKSNTPRNDVDPPLIFYRITVHVPYVRVHSLSGTYTCCPLCGPMQGVERLHVHIMYT
jgi:hypothetical protein